MFCLNNLNVVYGDCGVFGVKRYYNNSKVWFGFVFIGYWLFFVKRDLNFRFYIGMYDFFWF